MIWWQCFIKKWNCTNFSFLTSSFSTLNFSYVIENVSRRMIFTFHKIFQCLNVEFLSSFSILLLFFLLKSFEKSWIESRKWDEHGMMKSHLLHCIFQFPQLSIFFISFSTLFSFKKCLKIEVKLNNIFFSTSNNVKNEIKIFYNLVCMVSHFIFSVQKHFSFC